MAEPTTGIGSGPGPRPSRRDVIVGAPAVALAVALVGLPGCSGTTTSPSGSTAGTVPGAPTGGTAATTARPPADVLPGWRVYGHDLAQTRTNLAERSITRETVGRLATTWEIPDLVGVTGTPAVVPADDGDGAGATAYFADWKGQVWAVDAATGEKRWTATVGGAIVAAIAVDGDLVYAASGASLVALDRATGTARWKATTDDHPQAQISASPVVVDGLVLQGTASFENMVRKDEYLFRGSIAAFDAATGEQRWRFTTTAGDASSGAGAGIWSTPAVDRDRGVLYVGTGQGLSEPTPAMADSLLALDLRTGDLKWSTQFTYPDVFSAANPTGKDADVGASPNLWEVEGRALVGAGDKGGTFHAVDRDTGEVVWETQLTPGSAFGGEIGSAAYVDGVLVASSNVGDPETNAPTNVTHVFGLDPATGAKQWTSVELTGKIFAPVSAVPGLAFVGTDQGLLMALDTATGAEVWRMDAPAKTSCGPSIVDGRVLWGYGFVLFGGPGPGGILALEVAS